MRILIAEDNRMHRTVLRENLVHWGYDVVEAENGEQAWDALQRENAPRLAILDWLMPELDGIEVCRRIKRSDRLPFTYVVMLTGRDRKEDMVEGLDAGADDYLTKPLDTDLLRSRLAAGRRIVELVPPKEWSAPRVPGYVVERQLGKGAFATVWEATQQSTNRRCALKILRVDLVSDDVAERFAREIQLVKRLDHPGITKVYDGHVDESIGWFAMEYVDGWTLERFARKRSPKPVTILKLVAEICEALEHAHRHGVVHRDLKPANVMLTREGRPKLVDFGLGKSFRRQPEPDSSQSMAGSVIGTPMFMAPEQARGHTNVDGRADVYALGIVLYVLLLRRHPHDVEGLDRWQTIRRIATDEPRPPSDFRDGFDPELERILMTALRTDLDARYQSAAEFGNAITQFVDARRAAGSDAR